MTTATGQANGALFSDVGMTEHRLTALRSMHQSSRRRLKYPYPGRKAVFQRARRQTRVVFSLQVHPEPGIHAKKDTQPHGRVRGNRSAAIQDVTDAAGRDVNALHRCRGLRRRLVGTHDGLVEVDHRPGHQPRLIAA